MTFCRAANRDFGRQIQLTEMSCLDRSTSLTKRACGWILGKKRKGLLSLRTFPLKAARFGELGVRSPLENLKFRPNFRQRWTLTIYENQPFR